MSVEKFIPIKEEKITENNAEEQMDTSSCDFSEPFVLMVLGDSMEPEFLEGDVIVIEPAGTVKDGAFVVAQHNGEYIFRQLIVRGGRYYLNPLNPAYVAEEIPGIECVRGVITQKKSPKGGRRSIKKYEYN